jgi:hypothetical protein
LPGRRRSARLSRAPSRSKCGLGEGLLMAFDVIMAWSDLAVEASKQKVEIQTSMIPYLDVGAYLLSDIVTS